jgi:FkbM family methyltransferase
MLKNFFNKITSRITKEFEYLYTKIKINQYPNIRPLWVGNKYGGFFIYQESISPQSVIYSFGIGEDTSFDEEMIRLFGVKIFAFDPTPRAIKWIKKKNNKKIIFSSYGIDIENTERVFFMPKNPTFVSGSLVKTDNVGEEYIKVKVKNLETIMKEKGHNKLDVLKIDIEGSEYEILEQVLEKKIQIDQILVEFHDRFVKKGTLRRRKLIKDLEKAGYIVLAVSESFQEFSFIKKTLTD